MITNISGFHEYLPEDQIAFEKVIEKIKKTFELYGFCPLETPAVERVSTLLAKGNDNEIYGIYRLTDQTDKKDLALRFDLTVPLARYVAQHAEKLVFPYRRYHIAPVWRGERPQLGRYRQFYQCDIDVIDSAEISIKNDAEVLKVVYEIFHSFGLDFEIRINNIKILNGIIKYVAGDVADRLGILRIIDKIEKISHEDFIGQLVKVGLSEEQLNKMLDFFGDVADNKVALSRLASLKINEEFSSGVSELVDLYRSMCSFGIPDENILVDLKLARGLTYYTGSVFETRLKNCEFSGSISGGGRYDNLTSLFCKKRYPGVGVTIGITRLIPILIERGLIRADQKTSAKVLVTTQNISLLDRYIEIANFLRKGGVNTEIFLQNKKLGQQMNYANKKGFRFAIIADQNELADDKVNLKNLVTGEQKLVDVHMLVNELGDSKCVN